MRARSGRAPNRWQPGGNTRQWIFQKTISTNGRTGSRNPSWSSTGAAITVAGRARTAPSGFRPRTDAWPGPLSMGSCRTACSRRARRPRRPKMHRHPLSPSRPSSNRPWWSRPSWSRPAAPRLRQIRRRAALSKPPRFRQNWWRPARRLSPAPLRPGPLRPGRFRLTLRRTTNWQSPARSRMKRFLPAPWPKLTVNRSRPRRRPRTSRPRRPRRTAHVPGGGLLTRPPRACPSSRRRGSRCPAGHGRRPCRRRHRRSPEPFVAPPGGHRPAGALPWILPTGGRASYQPADAPAAAGPAEAAPADPVAVAAVATGACVRECPGHAAGGQRADRGSPGRTDGYAAPPDGAPTAQALSTDQTRLTEQARPPRRRRP